MSEKDKVLELVQTYNCRDIAEIGVWRGELSRMLARVASTLTLVDPMRVEYNHFDYNGQLYECCMDEPLKTQEELDEIFLDVVRAIPQARYIRMPSVEAAKLVLDRSLDLVYIDAIHTYEACFSDIQAWIKKIRPGGILAGDDYYPEHRAVSRAVDETFGSLRKGGRTWYVQV